MPVLTRVTAYGGFIDKEQTKLAIEDGFDFVIRLDEEEAVDFSRPVPGQRDYDLTVRISCVGTVEDAMYSYKTSDPDVNMQDAIDEEHEDAVTELINAMELGDIATAVTRSDMLRALCELSKIQPYDEIIVTYGTDYDKYLEAYDGYVMYVIAQGDPLIKKHINLGNKTAERWKPCAKQAVSKEHARIARELARRYNIIDDHMLESEEKLEEKLYSVSEDGRKEGEAIVRDMSEDPIIPIYANIRRDKIKYPPTGVLSKICVRLRDSIEKKFS